MNEYVDGFLTLKGVLSWASHPGLCLDPQRGEWATLASLDSRKASVLGVAEVRERSPSLLLSLVSK